MWQTTSSDVFGSLTNKCKCRVMVGVTSRRTYCVTLLSALRRSGELQQSASHIWSSEFDINGMKYSKTDKMKIHSNKKIRLTKWHTQTKNKLPLNITAKFNTEYTTARHWTRSSLTPWNGVLLWKLIVAQLVKKLPTFYGTRKSTTTFTRARHWILSWAKWINSSIILPSTSGSPKWYFPSGLQTKIVSILLMSLHDPPTHLPWFCDHNNILWREQIMVILVTQFSLFSCYSSLLCPSILFSYTPNLSSSLRVTDQVSHPHKTTI
jgi:hypothetical protein